MNFLPSNAEARSQPQASRAWSLRSVFGVVVGLPVTLLFGILIVHGYYVSRFDAAALLRSQMVNEVKTRAKTLNHHLAMMSRYPDQIALAITIRKPENVDTMLGFQYAMLADNPTVYGNAIAWEPYAYDLKEKYCSPYVWRDAQHGGAVSNMLFTPANDYDYFAGWNWYDEPKKKYGGDTGQPSPLAFSGGNKEKAKLPRIEPGLWCAPYYDEGGGNVLMCTYSAPFFIDRRFAGVVTCDVTTDWISKFLTEDVFEGGRFILLSLDESIISHPDPTLIMKHLEDGIKSEDREKWKETLSVLREALGKFDADSINNRLPGNEGTYLPALSRTLVGNADDTTFWVEGIQLPSTGWVLLCLVPQQTAYGAANAHFKSNLLIFLIGLVLLSAVLFWEVDQWVVRPLRGLAVATHAVSEGNFDHQVEQCRFNGRELVEVSQHFNNMTKALRQSIATAVQSASAKERAETANRAKSEFLMLVSHELRTPLNGVLGAVELLQQTPLSSKQQEYVALQKESGVALLLLINNILDFSKSELGEITIHPVIFSPRNLIASLLRMLEFQTKSQQVRLDIDVADDVPENVFGDENRIQQVLLNLLGNAFKFSDDKGIRLTVKPEKSISQSSALRFEVIDQGAGISEERQKTLFDKRWANESISKQSRGGFGLGLAISKMIVDALHGRIGVRSKPGKGATFWIVVPLPSVQKQTPIKTTQEPETPIANVDEAVVSRPSIRILVAEDNRINRIVIKEMLTKAGYDCVLVENGREAIQAWKEQAFDLILMDCQMPEVDGYEATERIRQEEKSRGIAPGTPIIALTANTSPGDRELCLKLGMNSYCNKPIKSEELIQQIELWARK